MARPGERAAALLATLLVLLAGRATWGDQPLPAKGPEQTPPRLLVTPDGPGLVVGEWRLSITYCPSTDNRYDTHNNWERQQRLDEDQRLARARGEQVPNPLVDLLKDARAGRKVPPRSQVVLAPPRHPGAPAPPPLTGEQALRRLEERFPRARVARFLRLWSDGTGVIGAAREARVSERCAARLVERYQVVARPQTGVLLRDPVRYLRDACVFPPAAADPARVPL